MSKLDNILFELIDKYNEEDVILDRYDQDYAISPEDLLVERETREEAILVIKFAMDSLTEEDKKIIEMYVLENKTLEQIGNKLGYHKSTIMRKLDRIPNKVKKQYNKLATNIEVVKSKMGGLPSCLFLPHDKTFEEMRDLLFYKTPKIHIEHTSMGFPSDFLQKQYKWSAWYKYKTGPNAGLVIWKTANQCFVKDYLAKSFNTEKGEVVCTLCPRCVRSEKYIKISKL